MNKIKFFAILLLISLALGFRDTGLSGLQFQAYAQSGNAHEVVFTVPVGENGIHYEGVDIPEMLTWGPAAFTVAPDGSFWIADTVGGRLLHYSPAGNLLGKIDLKGLIVGATDVEAAKAGIWVLDQASMPPKVIRLAEDGAALGKYDLPPGLHLEDGLTGIALGNRGELLVEREGDAYVTQFTDATGNPVEAMTTNGYIHKGGLFAANASGLNSLTPKRGTILAGQLHIEVETEYDLGGMQILGFGPQDDFFVALEELALNPDTGLQVDQTVRHYDALGKYMGVARVPIAEQYTYVQQGLAIGPDGSVYVLATRPDRVEVWRLVFTQSLDSILYEPPLTSNPAEIHDESFGVKACVSRNTIISTASSYRNNSKYLSSTNINGACSGRQKPRYLGGAGTYSSVSYDWGGFDTVSGFNGYMYPNTYKAGDINTTEESCSRGVDCSGFVSRTWQLTSKHSTCTLENISTQLPSKNDMLRGDIYNKCGDHVVLFSSFGSDGMWDYESTTYNSYDRVVYIYSKWT
ncbi:MAG: hypothetical protein COS63_03600, partial [Anaerolineae bacterium CG06_land_8_20_14_3_00_57_67]